MNSQQFYKIKCTVNSKLLGSGLIFDMVHDYQVIKAPFSKQSTINSITIESDEASMIILDNEVKSNALPSAEVSIFGSTGQSNQLNLLKKSNYQIIALKEMNQQLKKVDGVEKNRRLYTLILVNPIIFWLSNNHSFNRISSGQAFDVLTEYESHLTSTFGDIFSFIKNAIDKNSYMYETILTRTNMDISIPKELLNKYKMLDTLGYYFFDDFNFSSNPAKAKSIACQLFSFGSTSSLDKIDILSSKYSDAFLNMEITNSYPALDFQLKFQSNSSTAFVSTPTGKSTIVIPTTTQNSGLKSNSPSTIDSNVSKDRKFKTVHSNISTKLELPNSHITLYGPDTPDKAVSRFNNTKALINNQMRSFLEIKIDQIGFDLIKLNNVYNLNDRASYNYIPIIIHYKFNKNKVKDITKDMICTLQVQFLEYEQNATI